MIPRNYFWISASVKYVLPTPLATLSGRLQKTTVVYRESIHPVRLAARLLGNLIPHSWLSLLT